MTAPLVLMLSAAHPPDDVRVVRKEGAALAEAGWRVRHLCPGPADAPREVAGVGIETYERRRGWRGRIHGIPALARRAAASGAAVLHGSEPDAWLAAILAARRCGARVVLDVHEHYPSRLDQRLPAMLHRPAHALMRGLCRLAGRAADAVVVAKDGLSWDFGVPARTIAVRNYAPALPVAPRRHTAGPLTLVHCGALGRSRGWPQMLAALRLCPPGTRLRLVGRFTDGSEADFLAAAARLGLAGRIERIAWLPQAEALARVAECDIGLVLFQRGETNHALALPHKLFDCMLAGLPVIVPDFATEVATAVRRSGCGACVDTGDPGAIAAAVSAMADPARRAELGAAGRRAALGPYGWQGEADRLTGLYGTLAPLATQAPARPALWRMLARSRRASYSPGMVADRPTRRAPQRILLNLAIDSLMAALAVPLAMLLAGPTAWPSLGWWLAAIPGGALALGLAGLPVRLAQQYWRYAGLHDLIGIAIAAAGAAALFWGGLHLLGGWRPDNAAFPVINALVLGPLLGLPRVLGRLRHARRDPTALFEPQPVLLVGAGDVADIFLRALLAERAPAFRVMGLLSLRERQAGRRMQGHPILGTVQDAPQVLDRLRGEGRLPALIVLASPQLQGPALEALLDLADRHGIPVRRAPSATDLDPAQRRLVDQLEPPGSARLHLKPIAIEDLLDRPQIPLDREGMARLVQGRRVLVTGAGGTIGGELARQVAALGPSHLTLLDHGEYVLYEIDLELRERHADVPKKAVLADVRDETRIRRLFEELKPELVFHAAALKHVPMVENDPLEGLLTNAQGTRIVADAAAAVGCRAMVFISTDKAVNPTSVMGASKRLAEMYCQALDMQARMAGRGMRCVTVRFGNVLGSTGSVVPLFRRQLERGGPLTVTHPDMRRYFMTVREAVGLVLQASVIGAEDRADQPPELAEGGIFFLDMGKPVKIVELARRMIRLAGLRPDEDVEIRFTGLRPGEKLTEELYYGTEAPTVTQWPGLFVVTPRTADPALVGRAIDEIAGAARGGNARAALAQLGRLVPEFDHNADGAVGAAGGGR